MYCPRLHHKTASAALRRSAVVFTALAGCRGTLSLQGRPCPIANERLFTQRRPALLGTTPSITSLGKFTKTAVPVSTGTVP